MTAKQARRAAKILRDVATSLPSFGFSHYNDGFKVECHTLAQALEEYTGIRAILEAPSRCVFCNSPRVEYNGGL